MDEIQLKDKKFINKGLSYIDRQEPFTILVHGFWAKTCRKNFPKFLNFLNTLDSLENLKGLNKLKRKLILVRQAFILFFPVLLWSALLNAHNHDMHFNMSDLGDTIKIEVKPIG